MNFLLYSKVALPLRVISLPIAVPLIVVGVAMSDSLNGTPETYGAAIKSYIEGTDKNG